MLAQALGVPLVPVKSQLLYAGLGGGRARRIRPGGLRREKGPRLRRLYRTSDDPLSPTEVVAPGDYDIERLCEPARGKRTLAVGDGAEKYRAEIEKRLPECAVLADFMPSGETACRIVGNAYAANPAGYADVGAALPFYARKSDAEVIREEKINGKRGG